MTTLLECTIGLDKAVSGGANVPAPRGANFKDAEKFIGMI